MGYEYEKEYCEKHKRDKVEHVRHGLGGASFTWHSCYECDKEQRETLYKIRQDKKKEDDAELLVATLEDKRDKLEEQRGHYLRTDQEHKYDRLRNTINDLLEILCL